MSLATTIVAVTLASLSLAAYSVNARSARGEDTAPIPTAGVVAEPRVVTVTGEDYRFAAPEVVPAGLTTFRFLNKGPDLHHMALLRLAGGKTFNDLKAALAKPGPLPAWVHEVGGPNAAAPGEQSNATVTLEPGNYALICFVDLGGPPHFTKGMLKALRVTPASISREGPPKPDVTMLLYDYNFTLSSPIKAGKRTIEVENRGRQHHEVQLVQLAPGVSAKQFMDALRKAFEKPAPGQTKAKPQAPPGKPVGGIAGLDGGKKQTFTATFVPGNYALICFLPDAKDGKPHYVHGMVQQIAVK